MVEDLKAVILHIACSYDEVARALRASVGSTDASASLPARVGVVGPKRASFDSAARYPHVGTSHPTDRLFPDTSETCHCEEAIRRTMMIGS
jgi:hypothetical protein